MKIPLIIAHERSGWHFFANSLALNFGFDNRQIDVPLTTDAEILRAFFAGINPDGEAFSGKLLKSHHDYFALQPAWEIINEKCKVFYIIRDGRDVMTSCFYYFNKYSDRDFFKSETVSELIRRNPEGIPFHHCYWSRPVQSMADRWSKHVEGYIGRFGDNHIFQPVWYETLYHSFENIIRRIAGLMDMDMPKEIRRPTLKDRSIFPRKGEPGDWINHFKAQDELYFYKVAEIGMKMGGYLCA